MLNRIEQKLTSILGDDLVSRNHLSVVEAPGPPTVLGAGQGTVLVSVSDFDPELQFQRDKFSFNGTQSRRLLHVRLVAQLDVFLRPAGTSAAQVAQARERLLEDVSLISHGLDRPDIRSGKAFAMADPDPGFRVLSFDFETAKVNRDSDGPSLTASLKYRSNAEIWPPGIVEQEGSILGVDTVLAALPADISASKAPVRAGGTSKVQVRSVRTQRLGTLDPPATQSLQLAVTVMSDAPPAARGSIAGGTPGAEAGFRIIPVTSLLTEISYQAPAAGISQRRVEYVAIHLATPDSHRGVFLGSAAITLEPS